MKKPIRLKEYIFEKFEVRLGKFPGTDAKIYIDYGEGKREVLFHKEKRNWAALRWAVSIGPKKKRRELDLSVSVSIVGIFEVSADATHDEVSKLLEKEGPPILYEKIRAHAKPILIHSMFTNPELPAISFKRRKLPKKPQPKK